MLVDVAVTGYVGTDQECNGLMILVWSALGLPVILAFKLASVTAMIAVSLLLERYTPLLAIPYHAGCFGGGVFLLIVVINNLLLVGG